MSQSSGTGIHIRYVGNSESPSLILITVVYFVRVNQRHTQDSECFWGSIPRAPGFWTDRETRQSGPFLVANLLGDHMGSTDAMKASRDFRFCTCLLIGGFPDGE